MTNNKKNSFIDGYDKIRNSVKHPEVSYKPTFARTKPHLMEFNSRMSPQKQSNFGSE